MNGTFRSIFLLKSISNGLLLPVMSLMIVARGASLSLLPLVVGTYSVMVILLEFPSGVFCDLFGRKKTFLLSVSLMLLAFCVLLAGDSHVNVLFLAFAIQGAGRAFSSGSLDALVMERSLKKGGDVAAAKTSGELGLLESVGIALGSIAAGFLGEIGDTYSANIAAIALCYFLILLLTVFGVSEERNRKSQEKRPGFQEFGKQMTESLSFARSCPEVRFLMSLGFFTGIALLAVETYWQPGLLRLLDHKVIWLFGFVSFLGFGFTALSSHLAPKLMERLNSKGKHSWWYCLLGTKMLFYTGTILLGSLIHPVFFICGYFFIYFVHGGGSIMENTLLSKTTPGEMLASVMSLFSLIFQMGALAASGITSTLLAKADLAVIWRSFGILAFIGTGISFFLLLRSFKTHPQASSSQEQS